MNKTDKSLGMNRPITRRDLLQGVALASTSLAMSPFSAAEAAEPSTQKRQSPAYPPALDGLRGNHQGSFEVSHGLARYGQTDWGNTSSVDDVYDLVIVGAGISGLSAAHFYAGKYPDARILILDNHDDFGGHAKRNEFEVNGRKILGYGGAQTMQEPSGYSDIVKGLLKDLDIDVSVFDTAYDQHFYRRNKLAGAVYFDRKRWGKDTLVNYDLSDLKSYIPLNDSTNSAKNAVDKMPISAVAKQQMLFLLENEKDLIPDVADRWEYLRTISYREFLVKYVGITEPDVFAVLQDLAGDSGVGIESINAGSALWYGGLPGWNSAGLPPPEPEEAYIHHFPDGNASVARQLVRRMVPAVAPGRSMDSLITATFDYSKLDQNDTPVKIRLNSTVVNVERNLSKASQEVVTVRYVRHGKSYAVTSHACVLACNNSMIPYLCPQLPKTQKEALASQVKSPILYTTVALTNWRAWKNLGIGAVVCPTSYHINAMIDFPVSYGDYRFASNPDEPIVVHMERFPHLSNAGLTVREQYRQGRRELLSTPFETIERNVRLQLQGLLGAGGFDAAKDIAGITVNRWAHGYAYYYNAFDDETYEDDNDERYPHMIARKPFGPITIANADSAANAMLESAVEQAHRAVTELG
ncbi:MAG: NAD(P)/FAD-dependent oxidoreductase [Porticoccaceae bacterium]|nr:NAD(P)/FAD-dependent oxidoreductase [Porticoccaceae bacterium]